MKYNLSVGRVAGIPVQFHWSFVLVVAWLFYDNWTWSYGMDWLGMAGMAGWVAIIFIAIFLHELGHALVARLFSVGTERIVLYPIGGGAFLDRIPEEPSREIGISLAGPGVNLVLALLVSPFVLSGHFPNITNLFVLFLNKDANVVIYGMAWWEIFVYGFFLINLLLAVFNLLPIFPLDGGRVLRAALSWKLSRMLSTNIAAGLGVVGAFVMLLLGWYNHDPFLGFSGVLIGLMAGAEMKSQRKLHLLGKKTVADAMTPAFKRIYIDQTSTLRDIRQHISGWPDGPILIMDQWQQPFGVTTKAVLNEERFDEYALFKFKDIAGYPNWTALHPGEPLLRAVDIMEKQPAYAFPVIDSFGRVVGLLDPSNIAS